jgi:hypothetical protein
LEETGGEQE